MGIIDLDLQGHLAIRLRIPGNLVWWHSAMLLDTDLGQPRGVTCPNIGLIIGMSDAGMIHNSGIRFKMFNDDDSCDQWSTLTDWGQMTHICVGKLGIIGSLVGGKPLSEPMLEYCSLIGPSGTNFGEILIEILTFSFKKCVWKCRLRSDGHFATVSIAMCSTASWFHVTSTRGNLYSVTKCAFRTYSLYEHTPVLKTSSRHVFKTSKNVNSDDVHKT